MGKSYSEDLRFRVVQAVVGGMSRHEAARRFSIGVSSAIRWMQRFEREGHVRPGSPRGTIRSPLHAHRDWLLALVRAEPDLILVEVQERLCRQHGLRASLAAIWRFFDRENLSFKKNSLRHRAAQRSRRPGARRLARRATPA